LHTRQQTLEILDTTTGKLVKMTLTHEGNNVREFYSKLPRYTYNGPLLRKRQELFLNELRIPLFLHRSGFPPPTA
jgi:hypothetical protein